MHKPPRHGNGTPTLVGSHFSASIRPALPAWRAVLCITSAPGVLFFLTFILIFVTPVLRSAFGEGGSTLPQMHLSNITIVIPTKNRPEQIQSLVSTLLQDYAFVSRSGPKILLVCDQDEQSPWQNHVPTNIAYKHGVSIHLAPTAGPVQAFVEGFKHVTTPYIVLLCDDVTIPPPDKGLDWLRAAAAEFQRAFGGQPAEHKTGVVSLNDGSGNPDSHDFLLFDKAFFDQHVLLGPRAVPGPQQATTGLAAIEPSLPYRRYFLDTEIFRKAQELNLATRCEEALVTHNLADGRDFQTMAAERLLFYQRMLQFRQAHNLHKFFIGIPVYQSVPPIFLASLCQFVAHKPFRSQLSFKIGDSLISRARNHLTADFLESDCTHLIFLDSDLGFSSNDLTQLVSHFTEALPLPGAGKAIKVVGGIYPIKDEGPLRWCVNAFPSSSSSFLSSSSIGSLEAVRYIGTGFICIPRQVFELFLAASLAPAYHQDTTKRLEHDFWPAAVYPPRTADGPRPQHVDTPPIPDSPGRYLSEDWLFCQRCLDLGIPVYADRSIQLKHAGHAIWPLQSQTSQTAGPTS